MDRREFMTGAAAQVVVGQAVAVSPDEQKKQYDAQYEICKVHGHLERIPSNTEGLTTTTLTQAVFIYRPPQPATQYWTEQNGEWKRCFYCNREYRFVTKMEER